MRIRTTDIPTLSEPCVGSVYPVGGGYGRKAGHLMVLIAITEPSRCCDGRSCLFLIVDRDGRPTGVTSYGYSAIADRAPVAFVPGLDEMEFAMEPLS